MRILWRVSLSLFPEVTPISLCTCILSATHYTIQVCAFQFGTSERGRAASFQEVVDPCKCGDRFFIQPLPLFLLSFKKRHKRTLECSPNPAPLPSPPSPLSLIAVAHVTFLTTHPLNLLLLPLLGHSDQRHTTNAK